MTDKLNIDFQSRLTFMKILRERARDITLPIFNGEMDIMNKAGQGEFDPVTNADRDAEAVLRDLIANQFPHDSIEGEEFDDITGSNAWSWTLDPIDGTRGFVAGIPVWSTLIALSHEGRPILGLIDHPALQTSFWGAPERAWSETERGINTLKARQRSNLQDCIIGCTEPLAMFRPGERAAYEIIRRGTQFSRLGLDAYGYGMVASGRMDIIIEAQLKPCDVRALMPIIEGAGGKITNWHGGNPVNGGRAVAVGDPSLLPELYTYLGRAMDD